MKAGISYLILVIALIVVGLANSMAKPAFMLSSEVNATEVIPVTETMKIFSFGFDSVVADLYWLKEVQYIGKHLETDKKFPDLYHLTDFITDMDNHFIAPYYISAFILASDERNWEETRKTLDKGIEYNPDDFTLMGQAGFISYYYLKNSLLSADYFEKAGNVAKKLNASDAVRYYSKMVSELRGKGLARSSEIAMLENAYQNAKDPITQKQIAFRIMIYVIAANLDDINRAIYDYHLKYGSYPQTLQELVSTGYFSRIPQDPRGFDYKYDSVSGVAYAPRVEMK